MDLPKILLTGLAFLVFLEFLDSWAWDSKNLEENQINQKNKKTNPEWTYPRLFSQDCFFFGFPRVFGQLGLGQQKPREKPNKPKKPILNGLPQDSSHRIGFFLFSSSFWTIGLGRVKKPREKQKKQKKTIKTILNGLTQDSSHRIVFFVFFGFPRVFGQLGLGQQKPREKPNKPKKTKNNPEWTYPRFFSQDCFCFLFFFCGFLRVFGQLGLGE